MKNFYRLNVSAAPYRELWRCSKNPVEIVLHKLLGRSILGSSDDPNVESLAPFEVDEAALPAEIRQRFQPLTEELQRLGFHSPVYHAFDIRFIRTVIYWATFCHSSGRACARIHYRLWLQPRPPRQYLFPIFITALKEGGYLVTSGGRQDMLPAPGCEATWYQGASADELWKAHEHQLEKRWDHDAVLAKTASQVRVFAEEYHAVVRDFHLRRGVFVPFPKSPVVEGEAAGSAGNEVPQQDAEVVAELTRLQAKSSNWVLTLILLTFSLLIFVATFAGKMHRVGSLSAWKFLAAIVGILFVHELGHLAAMRWFNYRNLRMLFIPFIGAAALGRHDNVPGWKRAVVALMGPVPGIAAGIALGEAGLALHRPWLVEVALLALFLNAFNLLPFLPLDGGWVVHATLFCRHRVLDLVFRLAAAVVLLVLGTFIHWSLVVLALSLLAGLAANYRMARIADNLRASRFPIAPASMTDLPTAAALEILPEVRKAFKAPMSARTTARAVVDVFQRLNARPPGWIGSIALLGVLVVSMGAAVGFSYVLVKGLVDRWSHEHTPYHRGSARVWPDRPPEPAAGRVTILANLKDAAQAEAVFHSLPRRLPPTARLTLFGRTLLLSLPEGAATDRAAALAELRTHTAEASEARAIHCTLTCRVPVGRVTEEAQEDLHAYLDCMETSAALVPPWSPLWDASPRLARWRKSRRTYQKLRRPDSAVAVQSPEYREAEKAMYAAVQRHDAEETKKWVAKIHYLQWKGDQEYYESIRAKGDQEVDIGLVDQYLSWWKAAHPDPEASGPYLPPAHVRGPIARRLGVVAVPGTRKDVDRSEGGEGSFSRTGSRIHIWLTPRCTEVDLPALGEWLYTKGFRDVAYTCIAPEKPDDIDDDI